MKRVLALAKPEKREKKTREILLYLEKIRYNLWSLDPYHAIKQTNQKW